MAYLEECRDKLTIPAREAVEIRVDFTDGEVVFPDGRAWMECIPCEAELAFVPFGMECPSCGNQVTAEEMRRLAEDYIAAIRARLCEPSPQKRRGRLWRFIHWFRRNGESKV